MKIIEEQIERNDNLFYAGISLKFPWYSLTNKLLGIFGLNIAFDTTNLTPLIALLELVIKNGLLTQNDQVNLLQLKNSAQKVYLSQREMECAQLLLKGKTAKMIAKTLGLSSRTVEHYLENVKAKYQVTSKADLIEKLISKCFIDN